MVANAGHPENLPSMLSNEVQVPFPALNGQLPSPTSLSSLGTSPCVSDGTSEESSQETRGSRLSRRRHRQNLVRSVKNIGVPEDIVEEYGPPLKSKSSREDLQGADSSEIAAERSAAPVDDQSESEKRVLKLSPHRIHELTSSPKSLPLHAASAMSAFNSFVGERPVDGWGRATLSDVETYSVDQNIPVRVRAGSAVVSPTVPKARDMRTYTPRNKQSQSSSITSRPGISSRTVSTPPMRRKDSSLRTSGGTHHYTPIPKHDSRTRPPPLQLETSKHPTVHNPSSNNKRAHSPDRPMSPLLPSSIPLPPLSIPVYLQLELSSSQPSPLYIHRSATSEFQYESSKVKFERIVNFLLLAPQLEQVLWFGTLACLDAWLYSFTVLPLRFFKALGVLIHWWASSLLNEIRETTKFTYVGLGRVWRRRGRRLEDCTSSSGAQNPVNPTLHAEGPNTTAQLGSGNVSSTSKDNSNNPKPRFSADKSSLGTKSKHRRSKSLPSALLPSHKADLLKGLVVLFSCFLLMRFDASRMYHFIRGQAAIKLYVIYNALEVGDRLLSALGQDVFECLFSKETLERKPDGRSKVLRPFGIFLLALSYNVIHATALFYQVITLNVAVNSYSNALLALILSNQFVEIKSTVFKKFERENLFQLTCADIVERFQLWLMLLIIASRNLVEIGIGGLGAGLGGGAGGSINSSAGLGGDFTSGIPVKGGSILPKSFTIFPNWTGQVMGPFLLVLGSEILVDWLKHAYITKFNNTKPAIYGRFLDVLAKDYYSHAFADQNLTRRLGLPVIPLSCLFIRASLQTYHMFVATHVPLPIPSTATSLSESSATSPATTAALQHFDTILRRALGRSSFRVGGGSRTICAYWNMDDAIAFMTMLLFFLVVFLLLLAAKLVLGMLLLKFARNRYKDMKEREREAIDTGGKRIGGWGVVDVDDDKRKWIYKDDPEGMRLARERERSTREKDARVEGNFGGVSRYSMVAKRIW